MYNKNNTPNNNFSNQEMTSSKMNQRASAFTPDATPIASAELVDELCENDSLTSTNLYNAELEKVTMLSPEQEQELGAAMKAGGPEGEHAFRRLIEANTRLVAFCAKKYSGSNCPMNEMIACGNLGLVQAAKNFDYSLGFRFSTYAMDWIQQAIVRGIQKDNNRPTISYATYGHVNKIKKVNKEYQKTYGREATLEELLVVTELSKEQIANAYLAMSAVVSFDDLSDHQDDVSLGEKVGDDKAMDPYAYALLQERKEIIAEVLDSLPKDEGRVLSLRMGFDVPAPMTLEEIGKLPEFNLSRERIRQIESKAKKRLRTTPKYRNKLLDLLSIDGAAVGLSNR